MSEAQFWTGLAGAVRYSQQNVRRQAAPSAPTTAAQSFRITRFIIFVVVMKLPALERSATWVTPQR
jgi:hypothetical protein